MNHFEQAWHAAVGEGVSFFVAATHVAASRCEFVSHSWEEGGYLTDDDGEPRSDVRGNTVSYHRVETLEMENPAHRDAVLDWYG